MRRGLDGGSAWTRAMAWRINRRVSLRSEAGEFLLRISILKADSMAILTIRPRFSRTPVGARYDSHAVNIDSGLRRVMPNATESSPLSTFRRPGPAS
jgi:hypothetical protein